MWIIYQQMIHLKYIVMSFLKNKILESTWLYNVCHLEWLALLGLKSVGVIWCLCKPCWKKCFFILIYFEFLMLWNLAYRTVWYMYLVSTYKNRKHIATGLNKQKSLRWFLWVPTTYVLVEKLEDYFLYTLLTKGLISPYRYSILWHQYAPIWSVFTLCYNITWACSLSKTH